MKTVYIFSGLGADERVFQKLDLTWCKPVFIQWISPAEDESIESYAGRISKQIKTENPVIIGLSFGGMIAVEVAKQMKVKQLVLIASAKNKFEIPMIYRLAGTLRIVNLLPAKLLKRPNFITQWLFGAKTMFEKNLLKQILLDTNPVFLKWAMQKICLWQNVSALGNVIHIHGTKDRILPFRKVNLDIAIKNGGHFMTLSHHEEISGILKKLLNHLSKN